MIFGGNWANLNSNYTLDDIELMSTFSGMIEREERGRVHKMVEVLAIGNSENAGEAIKMFSTISLHI